MFRLLWCLGSWGVLTLRLESCRELAFPLARSRHDLRCRHMGHFSCELSCFSHENIQCYTAISTYGQLKAQFFLPCGKSGCIHPALDLLVTETHILNSDGIQSGHSSPGNLHLEHVLSYGLRQIPHTSSSGMSQRHAATAFHSLIGTFIWSVGGDGAFLSIQNSCCRNDTRK